MAGLWLSGLQGGGDGNEAKQTTPIRKETSGRPLCQVQTHLSLAPPSSTHSLFSPSPFPLSLSLSSPSLSYFLSQLLLSSFFLSLSFILLPPFSSWILFLLPFLPFLVPRLPLILFSLLFFLSLPPFLFLFSSPSLPSSFSLLSPPAPLPLSPPLSLPALPKATSLEA